MSNQIFTIERGNSGLCNIVFIFSNIRTTKKLFKFENTKIMDFVMIRTFFVLVISKIYGFYYVDEYIRKTETIKVGTCGCEVLPHLITQKLFVRISIQKNQYFQKVILAGSKIYSEKSDSRLLNKNVILSQDTLKMVNNMVFKLT